MAQSRCTGSLPTARSCASIRRNWTSSATRARITSGRHIAEFHVDPPVIADILARLARGEKLDKYEARLKAKDGTIRHVLISSNVHFRDGQFVNTRCFTLDVTGLKKAETALRESEQRLRATHDRAFAGIAEVGLDGRFLRANARFYELTGYGPVS